MATVVVMVVVVAVVVVVAKGQEFGFDYTRRYITLVIVSVRRSSRTFNVIRNSIALTVECSSDGI